MAGSRGARRARRSKDCVGAPSAGWRGRGGAGICALHDTTLFTSPLMTSRRLMVRWFRSTALPWYRLARWYRRSPTRSQGRERATTQPPGGSANQAYQPPVAWPATGTPPMEIVTSIGGEASPAQPAGSCASRTMVWSSGGAAGPETFWMRPSQAYSPISHPSPLISSLSCVRDPSLSGSQA